MADNRKLAQGLMMMTPAMREDLAGREQDIQRGKTVELLRRAGKEMYENPIVNTAVGLSPVLGDIQAGVEAYRSAQAGDWGNAGLNAAGMLPFIPMLGKTVWHGSPHTFDKFDLSKIGTGEGAQAYGHGLYLAEARPTAEEYRTALTGNHNLDKFNPTVNGEIVDTPVTKAIIRGGGKPEDFIKSLEPKLKSQTEKLNMASKEEVLPGISDYDMAMMDLADTQKMIDEAKSYFGKTIKNEPLGALYKVDLPDEQIAKMLDWDKPLSEQPKNVQEALAKFDPDMYHVEGGDYDPTELGQMVYSRMSQNPAEASQRMYQAGIPGIQYLDQASRGAGDGTRNYVVFSDEIPQILERNGQPVAQALREYKQLESLNPTGTVMTEYNPLERASLPLGKNLTTLDVTSGVSPDEMIEIYRGVPQGVSKISPGDFITTNRQLAQDYAGGGNVISQKVPYRTILDDLTEPLGEEYIYRP